MGSRLCVAATTVMIASAALSSAAHAQETPPAGSTGEAHDAESDRLFRAALVKFEERHYEAAIAMLEQSYELHQSDQVLYALAQAERLSGDCPTALRLYRRFLEHNPPAGHAEAARHGIERCERALDSRPLDARERAESDGDGVHAGAVAPPPAAPPAGPEESAPAISFDRDGRPGADGRGRNWMDPLGAGLLGAGVASLAAGGALFWWSGRTASDARHAESYDAYRAGMDRAESRRTYAFVALGSGAALAAAAAVRYATLPATGRARLAVTPAAGGASVAVSGRF